MNQLGSYCDSHLKVVKSCSHISTQVQGCSIYHTHNFHSNIHVSLCVHRCTELWMWIYQSHIWWISIWSYTFACKLQLKSLASSQQNLYYIYLLLCVQYQTPDDGQKTCPKHVEFYSKNKFEKLVQLIGFIIRIYHDARSTECQIYVRKFNHAIQGVPGGMDKTSGECSLC